MNNNKHRKAWIVASLHYRKACLSAAGTMDHKIAYLAGQELGTIANAFGALDSEDPGCVQSAAQSIKDTADKAPDTGKLEARCDALAESLSGMTEDRDAWEARADRYADKATALATELGQVRADIDASIREAIAEVDKPETPEPVKEDKPEAGKLYSLSTLAATGTWEGSEVVEPEPVKSSGNGSTCEPTESDLAARFPHLSPVVARAAWARAASLEID